MAREVYRRQAGGVRNLGYPFLQGGASALHAERRCEREEKERMPNKGKGLGRPLWTITSNQTSQLDVLASHPDDDGGFLPVFSFEEEAETFLGLLGDAGNADWTSREMTTGELISMLLAPCAEVKRVALDPLPLPLGSAMLPFVSVTRARFVQELMG